MAFCCFKFKYSPRSLTFFKLSGIMFVYWLLIVLGVDKRQTSLFTLQIITVINNNLWRRQWLLMLTSLNRVIGTSSSIMLKSWWFSLNITRHHPCIHIPLKLNFNFEFKKNEMKTPAWSGISNVSDGPSTYLNKIWPLNLLLSNMIKLPNFANKIKYYRQKIILPPNSLYTYSLLTFETIQSFLHWYSAYHCAMSTTNLWLHLIQSLIQGDL